MRPSGASKLSPASGTGASPTIKGRSSTPSTKDCAAAGGIDRRARPRSSAESPVHRMSALPPLAIEGGAAGLDDAGDPALAHAARARLALAVVDGEAVLEIAELAIRPAMVAQARAAGLD